MVICLAVSILLLIPHLLEPRSKYTGVGMSALRFEFLSSFRSLVCFKWHDCRISDERASGLAFVPSAYQCLFCFWNYIGIYSSIEHTYAPDSQGRTRLKRWTSASWKKSRNWMNVNLSNTGRHDREKVFPFCSFVCLVCSFIRLVCHPQTGLWVLLTIWEIPNLFNRPLI